MTICNDLDLAKVEFVADEKDLESDEALWALYERWCKAFNQERSLEEMARRFSKFKQTVLMLDSNKKARLPYRLEINWFADGKDIEL
uniref:Cathepsin propeptide inhibitor domain-containing protein n=1 Tax=Setaria italica TaxID=4555 RepID=K3YL64_SETIT